MWKSFYTASVVKITYGNIFLSILAPQMIMQIYSPNTQTACHVTVSIVCIGVSTSPTFSSSPLLKLQTIQALSLFRQFPSYIWFFVNPPKDRIFQWTPIILNFFILNPSHLLKVTEFLVEIFQFKFFKKNLIKHFCL